MFVRIRTTDGKELTVPQSSFETKLAEMGCVKVDEKRTNEIKTINNEETEIINDEINTAAAVENITIEKNEKPKKAVQSNDGRGKTNSTKTSVQKGIRRRTS